MPLVRALRTINAIESGTTNAAALQTLLADAGRLGEFSALLQQRGQCRRIAASATAMAAITGSALASAALASSKTAVTEVVANPAAMAAVVTSTTAMAAIAANQIAISAVMSAPSAVGAMAPSVWAAYAPQEDMFAIDPSSMQVVTWRNAQGAASRHMAQSSTGSRPRRSGDMRVAGYTVPVWDGTDDFMSAGSADTFDSAGTADFTFFAVVRRTALNGDALLGFGSGGGFRVSSTSTAQMIGSGGGVSNFSNAGVTGATWALERFRKQGSNYYHSLNGGTDSTALTTTPPAFSNAVLQLGLVSSGGSSYFNGAIAEVWMLKGNGDASSAEVARITALLKTKYGV